MSVPLRRGVAGLTAAALAGLGLAVIAPAAEAAVSPSATVLIDEVYGGGGNSGAAYNEDFIELVNTGTAPADLSGWAVQYASATGSSWQVTALTGTIPPGGSFLVGEAFGTTTSLPGFTADVTGTIAMSGTAGKVALTSTTTKLTCGTGCASLADVVDLVGWGPTATSYAGTAPAAATANATSASRTAHGNTADNAADFTIGTPTPTGLGNPGPGPDPTPTVVPIEQVQGTGGASPLAGTAVTTRGVVTAVYAAGGLNGYVLQTPDADRTGTPGASPAVFVYSPTTVASVSAGGYVEVTGTVTEFNGLTEVTVPAGGLTALPDSPAVTPLLTGWPTTDAEREALESVLVMPTGDFTVSNTYSTNQYGEVGLAAGDTPLVQPTDVARPGTPDAAAVAADNAARRVVLDDGASVNFLSNANRTLSPSYISATDPVRVGAPVTFTAPVVVDYRNNTWKLDPTGPMTAGTAAPATFTNTRTPAPEQVGGDLRIATFNVLNYFTTLGADTPGCTAYTDRDGNGITVNSGCDVRGAWDAASLARQQAKIVAAINGLDADVVGLLEIENSAVVDGTPDEALATLVGALNAAAGSTVWAYVPSSTQLPPVSEMDVINSALIYRVAAVAPTGPSLALGTESAAGGAFDNAREPIGQLFTPADGGAPVFVAVNHLKSKGSAGPWPGDADAGDGQGSSNESRVRQTTALRDWIASVTTPDQAVALIGDFNSYTAEDPLEVLYAAGYTDALRALRPGDSTYSFDGLAGSLDHVLLNGPAFDRATGADSWNINAEESIALEYSRYNYHGTIYYTPDAYRSSDHDPVVVGLTKGTVPAAESTTTLTASPSSQEVGTSAVRLTATVTSTAPVEGAVEFVAGSTVLGSAPLAGGSATFALPASTPVGTYPVVARFGGTDGVVLASESTPVAVTVTAAKVPTSIVATSLGSTISKRSPLPTIVAAYVSQQGTWWPKGRVELREGSTLLRSADVVLGIALTTVPKSTMAVGTHTITATFVPSNPDVASSSTTFTVRITR